MIKILPILLIILSSCKTSKGIVTQPTFSSIYKNTNGGTDKAGYLHITTNEEYIKLIESLKIDESEYNKLVSVNFNTNDVLVVYQGQKNTGGYSIDVAEIHWENELLMVKTIEAIPEAGKPVSMVITSPYCITMIPKAKSVTLIK
jgi:enhancing lycopene biosynthesis protein 2